MPQACHLACPDCFCQVSHHAQSPSCIAAARVSSCLFSREALLPRALEQLEHRPAASHSLLLQVATREDPASARLNESLYRFIPRSIAGNLADGVEMELHRLSVRKQGFLSLHNRCARLPWHTAGGRLDAAC